MANLDSAESIENIFSYHPPFGSQPERYKKIREQAKITALMLLNFCPVSRERTLALDKLEECTMWANASISKNETFYLED